MQIIRAKPEDASALTELALAAKRTWGYPERWIERWRDELTIRPDFIASHETFLTIVDSKIAGFYALARKVDKLELAHFWVWPDRMGRGVGRGLFQHAVECARSLGFRELEIESDPNAAGFYEHMGARRVGARISRIDSENRELPVLIFAIDPPARHDAGAKAMILICQTCQKKQATVHISSVTHLDAVREASCWPPDLIVVSHLCQECAEEAQDSRPHLKRYVGPMLASGKKPVMEVSRATQSRIDSVNRKLSELDAIIQNFCTHRNYDFQVLDPEWFPARAARVPGSEISRQLHLFPAAPFVEILKRGFFPEMPWSLHACATVSAKPCLPSLRALQYPPPPWRLFSQELFGNLTLSEVANRLESDLERGHLILCDLTRQDVLEKGEGPCPGKPGFP